MSAKSQNDKIVFGLKVKQGRQAKGLSFAKLAKQTGMSVSYLNEIEKGKKYPKEDKITVLAQALEISYVELTSPDLNNNLSPVSELLRSNFLNELPLDIFGIELNKVVEIIANAPTRVGAFISTLLDLARNYELNKEGFYFGALRSYLELHDNYFPKLEDQVDRFIEQHQIPANRPLPENYLKTLLEEHYDYTVVENGIEPYSDLLPADSGLSPNAYFLV